MIRAMHFFQMNGRWIWIPWSSSWSRFSSDVLIQPFTIWARGRSLKTLQLSLSIYTTVTHIKTELWRRSEREREFHFHTNQHAAKTYIHTDWYAIKSPKSKPSKFVIQPLYYNFFPFCSLIGTPRSTSKMYFHPEYNMRLNCANPITNTKPEDYSNIKPNRYNPVAGKYVAKLNWHCPVLSGMNTQGRFLSWSHSCKFLCWWLVTTGWRAASLVS